MLIIASAFEGALILYDLIVRCAYTHDQNSTFKMCGKNAQFLFYSFCSGDNGFYYDTSQEKALAPINADIDLCGGGYTGYLLTIASILSLTHYHFGQASGIIKKYRCLVCHIPKYRSCKVLSISHTNITKNRIIFQLL